MIDDAINIKALKDVVKISAGYPLRGSTDALPTGDAHIIQLKNVGRDYGVDWKNLAQVALPSKRSPSWLKNEDVLFVARGANNFAIAISDVPPQTVCAPHFFILRVQNQSQLNPRFLAWQINQRPAQNYFRRSAVGTLGMNIRRSSVENLQIAVPTLHRQQLINKMHDATISEKEKLRALIETRNKQMDAVVTDLFHTNGDQADD